MRTGPRLEPPRLYVSQQYIYEVKWRKLGEEGSGVKVGGDEGEGIVITFREFISYVLVIFFFLLKISISIYLKKHMFILI